MMRNPSSYSLSEIKALIESENHLRFAEKINNHMSWKIDPLGNVTYISNMIERNHHITPQHEYEAEWKDFIHPDDLEYSTAKFWHSIKTGEPMDYENRLKLVGSDNEYRWARISARPRYNDDGTILCWYGTTIDIDDLVRHQKQQRVLLDELNHRVKNNLAVIQAIVRQTYSSLKIHDKDNKLSFNELYRKVEQRLLSLSRAHDFLTKNTWKNANFRDLVISSTFENKKEFIINGPEFFISSNAALLFAMIIHELSLNAKRHGSWSTDTGRVTISWTMVNDVIDFSWIEENGPKIEVSEIVGFGLNLIQRSMRRKNASAEVVFPPEGFQCRMHFHTDIGTV